jgi:hypothetical protein
LLGDFRQVAFREHLELGEGLFRALQPFGQTVLLWRCASLSFCQCH